MTHHARGKRAIEILLVEDSPSDRMLAVAALQQARLLNAVHTVSNGYEALAFLRREGIYTSAPRPDLILLDLNLPRMDGRELLRHVKTDPVLRHIPVVVLTTSSSPEDVDAAYAAHANSYITKPVDFGRFAESLQSLESYWFEVVTLPDETILGSKGAGAVALPRMAPSGGRPLTVLLTEDSATDALLVRAALDSPGRADFNLIHVTRVAEAVAELSRIPVDVIVTDLGLPDSEGLEVIRRLRLAAPWVPVVVLTGNSSSAGDQAIALGAEDYVRKDELGGTTLARAIRFAVLRSETRTERNRLQRVETVGRLSASVAHDFNNLLAAIGGSVEVMRGGDDTEDRESLLSEMLTTIARGRALTGQLLAFSRRDRYDPRPVACNAVVTDSTQLLRRLLDPDIHIELHLADDLPDVRADRHQLEQVVVNLGVNAGEAMPSGGLIRISTSWSPGAPPDANEAKPRMPCVEIRVSDTGPGVPEELRETIFEAFFTTKGQGMGTGLGLATVREIAERHGGHVYVEAAPSGGACFVLTLPPSNEAAPLADVSAHAQLPSGPSASATAIGPDGVRRTILVVEDEVPVLKPMVRLLERFGYEVLTAESADHAWDVWQHASQRVDLVLSDLVMPGSLQAIDLAVRIAQERPDVPVVFCSGYAASFRDQRIALREGENFVSKPFTMNELIGTIENAFARSAR